MADNPEAEGRVKLTPTLRAALEFLEAHRQGLRKVLPDATDEELSRAFWYPREPIYCWKGAYGDFSPAALKAGVKRGYVLRRADNAHGYTITKAGREALRHAE